MSTFLAGIIVDETTRRFARLAYQTPAWEATCDWLRFHDVDPTWIPSDRLVIVDRDRHQIRYTRVVRDEEGSVVFRGMEYLTEPAVQQGEGLLPYPPELVEALEVGTRDPSRPRLPGLHQRRRPRRVGTTGRRDRRLPRTQRRGRALGGRVTRDALQALWRPRRVEVGQDYTDVISGRQNAADGFVASAASRSPHGCWPMCRTCRLERQRSRPPVDPEIRDAIYRRDGNACLRCGARQPLTVDHIVPVVLGGTSNEQNLQTLCRSCNSSKGTKTADYRPHREAIQ